MYIIDSHLHIWSDDAVRYPWRPISGAEPPAVEGSAEWLIEVLDEHGVKAAVAVQSRVYGYDHSYLADCLRRFGGVIAGVGLVNMAEDPGSQVRSLAGQNFIGVRVDALGDPEHWAVRRLATRLWDAAYEYGVPVEFLIGSDQLDSLKPLLDRERQPLVVIEHMGLWGEMSTKGIRPLLELGAWPNVRVKITLADISTEGHPYADLHTAVQQVRDVFGARRMLWGSDMPWRGASAYRDTLDAILHHMPFLTRDDIAWILGRTAQATWETSMFPSIPTGIEANRNAGHP